MQMKKGVSLIVLVITIIVMIILAGTIILSLSSTDIMDRAEDAVNKTNLKTVQQLASTLWADAYLDGKTEQPDLKEAVINGLTAQGINTSDYKITVSTKGVKVTESIGITDVPEDWKTSVTKIVDTVPIPKGFVASPYDGENTKDGGLVIYELTQSEIAAGLTELPQETHETSMTTRNQFVWVPVASEDFTTKFVRRTFGLDVELSNSTNGYGYKEVVVDENNMPLETQPSYIPQQQAQAMYGSVKEYEGFYIARYAAGIDEARTSDDGQPEDNVYSMKNKARYTYTKPIHIGNVLTGSSIEASMNMYPEDDSNYGVTSTLTYSVQWDTYLQWGLDTAGGSSVADNNVSWGGSEMTMEVWTTAMGSSDITTFVKRDGRNRGYFADSSADIGFRVSLFIK